MDVQPPKTLGDILRAECTAPVSENEWVALVAAIAAGDQQALHALYVRTHRLVFTVVARITNNRHTAEELTVDVFHDVWRRASTYQPSGGTVVGWIMKQAQSRAIDRMRFEQRKKRVPPTDEILPAATGTSGPAEMLDLRETSRLLYNALAVLTPLERQAIEAAFFSELAYAEVAARLNEPLGTVKTRIRSALGKLRQALGATVKER